MPLSEVHHAVELLYMMFVQSAGSTGTKIRPTLLTSCRDESVVYLRVRKAIRADLREWEWSATETSKREHVG